MERMGPYSLWEFFSREKTMVVAMLNVGDVQSACSCTNASTMPTLQPSLMAVVANAMLTAVATVSQRSTTTGAAWRSAIAPKINGDTKAATADAAKA